MNKKKRNGTMIAILCLIVGAGLVAGLLFYLFGTHSGDGDQITYNFFDKADDTADFSIKGTNSLSSEAPVIESDGSGTGDADGNDNDNDNGYDMDKKFYTYRVTTRVQHLRIREAGSLTAKIKALMPKGTTGYVYERGDSWSLIEYKGLVGYSSNRYLTFTEIQRDELPDSFPEEYR